MDREGLKKKKRRETQTRAIRVIVAIGDAVVVVVSVVFGDTVDDGVVGGRRRAV